MGRKRKTAQDRQLDRLYESKNLAEEAAPRLLTKAISRFEKKLDAPCEMCMGSGVLRAKEKGDEEEQQVECLACGGDGKGAGLGKEDIMFLRFVQSLTLHKERLAEALGLNPKQLSGGGNNPLLTIIANGNVDIKAMTEAEREQFLLDMAGGKKPAPRAIEAEVVDAGS